MSSKNLQQGILTESKLEALCKDKIQAQFNKVVSYSQDPPRLGNQYSEDSALQTYLQLFYEKSTTKQRIIMENDLANFGAKVTSREYLDMMADAEDNKPKLEQFDAWGKRIDKLQTGEGWRFFKKEAAVEKLIQIPYKNSDVNSPDYNPNSRVHQVVKLFLFSASSGYVSCPLAMTDGAAYTLRELKRQNSPHWSPQLQNAFESLTSEDPKKMWTSGQWMTEKRGGSDVSAATDTFAIEDPQNSKQCLLYGYKWFTSAVDSEMTLALARFPQNNEELESGKGKLALVFVRIKDSLGRLNNIEVVRLKDKLGTRQLPTAELILKGTVGTRISNIGKGIKTISNMLTITRIHNALGALGFMRRILALANDYKERRFAFGKKLSQHQLHMNVLAKLEKTYRGNLLFLLECAYLLQKIDNGDYSQQQELRLMTSVLKLFTAKDGIGLISEGLELIGGLGYMENSRIPQILRDAQVLPIWEGTTNILSLDFSKDVFKHYKQNRLILQKILTIRQDQKIDSINTQSNLEVLRQYSQKYLETLDKIYEQKSILLIESQSRVLSINFALLLIPHIFLRRVMPVHYQDEAEVDVFSFWIERLKREYREAFVDVRDQEKAFKIDSRILRGVDYGRNIDDFMKPRHKL
eukprot:403342502